VIRVLIPALYNFFVCLLNFLPYFLPSLLFPFAFFLFTFFTCLLPVPVFGPLLFATYCSPISALCHLYGAQQQQYADDIHSFILLSHRQIREMNSMLFKPVLRHYKHGSILMAWR